MLLQAGNERLQEISVLLNVAAVRCYQCDNISPYFYVC